MELNKKPKALIIAGGGSDLDKGSVIGRLIQQNLDARNIPHKSIHGIHTVDNINVVRSPSEQFEEIATELESIQADERILLIAHCIGNIAAQKALDSVLHDPCYDINLLSISPPLPSPAELLNSSKSSSRRKQHEDGTFTMKTMQFKEGHFGDYSQTIVEDSPIPNEYFTDAEKSHDLSERLKLSVELGRAAIIGAQKDWNNKVVPTIEDWQAEWHQNNMDSSVNRCIIIDKVGHSLNEIKDPGDSSEIDIEIQKDAINRAIELGLSLEKEA